jgi:hypothetical protein
VDVVVVARLVEALCHCDADKAERFALRCRRLFVNAVSYATRLPPIATADSVDVDALLPAALPQAKVAEDVISVAKKMFCAMGEGVLTGQKKGDRGGGKEEEEEEEEVAEGVRPKRHPGPKAVASKARADVVAQGYPPPLRPPPLSRPPSSANTTFG